MLGEKKRFLWPALLLVPLVALAAVGRLTPDGSHSSKDKPLPVIAPAPAFTLTQRNGRTVTHDDLRGRVWVADLIFTRCTGPCPELTLRMRSLQNALLPHRDQVKLVSFSLDPEYDTPAVLKTYAARNHADPDLWWFLTSRNAQTMHQLVRKGFLQTVIPADDGNPIIHSTYFVLVDRAGRIRAFYDGLDPATKTKLLLDIKQLLTETTQ